MAKITVAQIMERQDTLVKLVDEHDKILIRGNGQPSLQEEVRGLKAYITEQKTWIKAIALLFLGQFITVGISMIVLFIRVLPILQKLSVETVLVH